MSRRRRAALPYLTVAPSFFVCVMSECCFCRSISAPRLVGTAQDSGKGVVS